MFCEPLGREAANALPALQEACDRLAAIGIAALRFSYAGTGDSAGRLDDPERVADWLHSVEEALASAQTVTAGPVVLIGMRMGALLAAEAIALGAEVGGLIQWDPCTSGRDFLRLEQTLLATGYGGVQKGDGSAAGPAFTYSPETVRLLTEMTLDPCPPSATRRDVVLVRVNGRGVSAARTRFGSAPVEWVEIDGQAELVDVYPELLTVPATAIKAVTDRVDRIIDAPAGAVRFEPTASAVVGHDARGGMISEHSVWLGPNSLFGIITEPSSAGAEASPTLVFLSAGALDHTGPGRMWVELARRLAGDGMRSIRIDLDGIGETFGRPAQARRVPKPPESIDDLADLAAALGDPDGRNLVFIGLSSGAYHGIEAGLHLHPSAVCAINPGLASPVAEMEQGAIDTRRRAYRPMPRVLRTLAVKHARAARLVWWAALQVWVTASPYDSLTGVSRRGTPVLLIASESDMVQFFEPSLYWSVVCRRLERRGLLDIEIMSGGDHSLYTEDGQDQAYSVLTPWLVSHCGRRSRASTR